MIVRELNFVFSDISELSELIPFLIGLFFVSRKPPYNLIVWFFAISALVKIISLVTAKLNINNMPIFHFLALFEIIFLYTFYCKVTFDQNPSVYILGLIVLINILNSTLNENIFQFNSMGWTLNTFILLCFGLRYLLKFYQEMDVIQIERNPLFIIN